MPTVVELTGAKYPTEYNGQQIQPMEGASLVPAFAGKPLDRKQPIFLEHEGNRAIRDGKWKLVMKFKGPWELYDMEADRTEQHDLITKEPQVADSTGEGMERLGQASGRRSLGRARSQRFRQRDQPPCQSDRRPKVACPTSGEKSGWVVGSSPTGGAFFSFSESLVAPRVRKTKSLQTNAFRRKGGQNGGNIGLIFVSYRWSCRHWN